MNHVTRTGLARECCDWAVQGGAQPLEHVLALRLVPLVFSGSVVAATRVSVLHNQGLIMRVQR